MKIAYRPTCVSGWTIGRPAIVLGVSSSLIPEFRFKSIIKAIFTPQNRKIPQKRKVFLIVNTFAPLRNFAFLRCD